jgi:ubiquinone/menaquinone biosynthesis C-methylase UbiE
MNMEHRKRSEKEFHDKIRLVTDDAHVADTRWSSELEETIKNNPFWSNMKYYAIERKSRLMVMRWYEENCMGKRVLDYCCGNGEDGIFIAKKGADEVIGIDISEVSVENCMKYAAEEGLKNIAHYVRDAENTGFDDSSFDIITEYGALHHLDIDRAFREMARILRPEGKIICTEALAHNIPIHIYRKMTPALRTEWEVEHIMRKRDLEIARKYFRDIEVHFYHLFTLLAVPFRNKPFFLPMLSFLERIDNIFLKLPYFRWQAWQAVFVLSRPEKKK